MFAHTCWSNWRGYDEAWAGALQSHGRSSSTCIPLTEVNHSLIVSGALNSDFFKIESSAWGLSITKFVDPFIHHCHLYPCYIPFISILYPFTPTIHPLGYWLPKCAARQSTSGVVPPLGDPPPWHRTLAWRSRESHGFGGKWPLETHRKPIGNP